MLDFSKSKDFVLCIDSDGTIMDTMTIKHEKCFGPIFLKVFKIRRNRKEILSYWNDVNLYKKTRGINRFEGLVKGLEFAFSKGYKIDGFECFKNWVETTPQFSETLLEEEIKKYPLNECLNLALIWSKEVNKAIKKLPLTQPFDGVVTTLKYAKKYVDLVGVSSANKAAVIEEWNRINILDDFKAVGCQDAGSKTDIIAQTLDKGYEKNNVLMVGDALGDYKASKNNGVLFFPIIPKEEEKSRKRLKEEGLIKFINNEFCGAYQDSLIDEFFNKLGD